ncbi:uncharacterized protein PV06_04054 [Exophiala oligosperma]|uniref:NAD-dependent epimerase/dehydratase domain-containing protein n=1 Tax=Exophiala oligosperma TaxID=215243 RepID=A0A0D2DRS3_9EURO|nr:uncharacterized protein PV06_04054 [Exophiala oligosperma]KIW45683.1 hypothetical protein PV06_04054 [Exophiala oligosperma]
MTTAEKRIAKGEWVLVTGSNGYIGSHIVDVLLQEGYNVRGSVRAEKPWLNKLFDERHGKGRFETVIVPSLSSESAFNEAAKGVSGIVHVASDVSFSTDADSVISGVVAGTLLVLKSAAKNPSVKSVVLTSSSSALLIPQPNTEVEIDENTWNDSAVEAAYSKDTPEAFKPLVVYAASKTQGEREGWKWYNENKPHYTFNTVLPNLNMGPILAPEIAGSTMNWTRNLLKGDEFFKAFPPQWFVDVRDDARLHVAALLDPKVKSQRIFAFAEPYNYTDIIALLHKMRPNNTKLPAPAENEGRDLTIIKPREKAEQLLKSFFKVPGWVKLEDSLAAGIVGFDEE